VRLHGDTESAARERYKHYLQESLSCIHPSAYFYMGKQPLATEWALSTQPAPIPLDVRDGRTLYLTATQAFRTRKQKREWRVSATEYIYNVSESEGVHDYMFAWHWHPNQRPECHLHVSAELGNHTKLDKKHFPTARVSFEEVLRFLIQEFNVAPAKKDWRRALAETQERHERYRSWWGSKRR
jgi:hypothetical protein